MFNINYDFTLVLEFWRSKIIKNERYKEVTINESMITRNEKNQQVIQVHELEVMGKDNLWEEVQKRRSDMVEKDSVRL